MKDIFVFYNCFKNLIKKKRKYIVSIINITCSCMDSKYCQYLYKNSIRTIVGIRGMDEYTMKYTYQISENVWLDWEFKPGTPA